MVFKVRSPKRLPLATLLLLPIAALVLSACNPDTPGYSLAPVGPAGQMEADLYNLIYIIAVIVFVLVEGLLLWATLRFRHRPTAPGLPVQTHGNTILEIGWTIAPTLILLFIAVPTLTTIASATAAPTGPDTLKVTAIGHQWWWEFDYPDLGVVTADEMHIPANTKVAVTVESADVIHSFWVPKVGGKIQAIPNEHNETWIQADQTGVFYAQCYQLCGASHANMRFRLVSQSKSDFDAWVNNQKQPAAKPTTPDALKGQQIFSTGACVGCHTVTGTNANGKIGPNLTHIGSHMTIAGATLENNPHDLSVWLHDPPAVKPGSIMPNLHLTDDQVNALVAYLESLK